MSSIFFVFFKKINEAQQLLPAAARPFLLDSFAAFFEFSQNNLDKEQLGIYS